MNWRLHLVSLAVFISTILIIRYIWLHPKIILYVFVGIIGILGYGGVYLIVKARLDKPN